MQLSDELQAGKAGEHLVCADLLIDGHVAFLSDQGLPYDVVVQLPDKLVKVQVKSFGSVGTKNTYKVSIKRGKYGRKGYGRAEADIFAFVALDTRQVGYILAQDCKSCMEFRHESHRGTYPSDKAKKQRRPRGKYLADCSFVAAVAKLHAYALGA